jgi:hypothetical protein
MTTCSPFRLYPAHDADIGLHNGTVAGGRKTKFHYLSILLLFNYTSKTSWFIRYVESIAEVICE